MIHEPHDFRAETVTEGSIAWI